MGLNCSKNELIHVCFTLELKNVVAYWQNLALYSVTLCMLSGVHHCLVILNIVTPYYNRPNLLYRPPVEKKKEIRRALSRTDQLPAVNPDK